MLYNYKQDYDISFDGLSYKQNITTSTSYGKIGIPARAIPVTRSNITKVIKSGTGTLEYNDVKAGETDDTSKQIIVKPAEGQDVNTVYRYDPETGIYTQLSPGMIFEWYKSSPLRFNMPHANYYPGPFLRSFDEVETYSYWHYSGMFRLSYNSLMHFVPAVYAEGHNIEVGTNNMPQAEKDKLNVGSTYYLRLYDTEDWKSTPNAHHIAYSDNMQIRIKIVEPDYTKFELNMDYDWENTVDGNGKNTMLLTPTGDGTKSKLDALVRSGRITSYNSYFIYYDQDGKESLSIGATTISTA